MKLEEGKVYLCELSNTDSWDEEAEEYDDVIQVKLMYVGSPKVKWTQPDGESVDNLWEIEPLEEVEMETL